MSDSTLYLALISRYPRLGWDQNVSVTPEIKLRFNLPINTALVDTDIELNKRVLFVRMDTDTTQPVSYVSWSAAERTLTITPTDPLAPGALYQITVRKGLQTAQGRSMLQDETWSFQTSAAALGQVSLLAPGDSSAWTTLPTLTWTGVWIVSGSVTYDVQVDDNFQFGDNPLWETAVTVATSGGIQTANIGTSLAGETTYFWRVRARTTSVSGNWSETRAFWVGTVTQASPDTISLFSPDVTFRMLEAVPEDRPTNQASWPLIQVQFSQPLSGASVNDGTVQIYEYTVDERPDTLPVQITANTYTLDGTTLTIVPAGAIKKNHRYHFTLTTGIRSASGDFLSEPINLEVIGQYQPIYGGAETVRQHLGNLIADVDTDDILYQLWRGSLHVNEILATRIHRIRSQATIVDLQNYQVPGGTTWGMMRYAELSAAIDLLDRRYYDLSSLAGQRGALATFEFEFDPRLLEQLQKRVEYLRGLRTIEEAAWFQEIVVPRTTGKSVRWRPSPIYPYAQDWSYRRRHSF